jgi:hypothetical protein
MNSKVKTDKQGETCDIIDTKLGLQAKSRCFFGQPLLAPFIGGQVSESWSYMIQIHCLRRLHDAFLIRIHNPSASILGHNLCGP